MALWNLNKLISELNKLPAPEREITNMASWLWEEGMGFSQHMERELSAEEGIQLKNYINRLMMGEPVQYIVGHSYFFGLKIKVTPAVLIPRPETEELIEWIIEDAGKMKPIVRILDIGTGSGCIPIALKNYFKKNADVTSIDISEKALEVASDNCIMNKANVRLINHDFIQEGIEDLGLFDIIVSNPPYISKDDVSDEVLQGIAFEPEMALFPPGSDPDLFYVYMSNNLSSNLEANGALYIEINEFRADKIRSLFQENGWEIQSRTDMQGKQRMLKLIRP